MIEIINIALLILMLWVTYYLLNKFSPIEPVEFVTNLKKQDLESRYKPYFTYSIIGILLGSLLLTFLLKWLLLKLIKLRIGFLSDVEIYITPDEVYIWIGAICMALYLAYTITIAICYNYLLHDWDEYLVYINQKIGFQIEVKLNYFNRIFSLLLILFTLMLFDNFYVFGTEEIKFNGFWGLGTTKYPYQAVLEVKEVAKTTTIFGNTINYPYHEVKMKDDCVWSSKNRTNADIEEGRKITDLVTTKAGIFLRKLEYE